MMLCLRKGAKVCGKRTLYFFTDFTRESNVTVVVVSPARSVYVSPLVSFGQLITKNYRIWQGYRKAASGVSDCGSVCSENNL